MAPNQAGTSPVTSCKVHRFLNSVAHLCQPCSKKGGFETRPYIQFSGTSTAKINAPPHSGSGRFQTCPELKQAVNPPSCKRSGFTNM